MPSHTNTNNIYINNYDYTNYYDIYIVKHFLEIWLYVLAHNQIKS